MTKPTKWHVHPAKTQISLGIHPIWSKLGSLATHWAHSEDSDQTGRMPRLIWVFAGRTCHFVGFVTRWLNYFCRYSKIWKYSLCLTGTDRKSNSADTYHWQTASWEAMWSGSSLLKPVCPKTSGHCRKHWTASWTRQGHLGKVRLSSNLI